jgi:hypothetical protein
MGVRASLLIHRGSAESNDSDDRMEAKMDALQNKLDELARANEPQAGVAEGREKAPL